MLNVLKRFLVLGVLLAVLGADTKGTSYVSGGPLKSTYMGATATFTPAAAPTDIFVITGSSTKTVRVLRIILSGVQTTAGGITTVSILKRSTADTAGTAVATTRVPLDSGFAAATAVVQHYTANPTVGTLIADIYRPRVFIPAAATATLPVVIFDQDWTQNEWGTPPTLRGAAETLAISLNATLPVGAATFEVTIMWTEE